MPLLQPFQMLLDPQERVFWPFLLASALLAAIIVLCRQSRQQRSRISSLIRLFVSRRYWLHRSALLDYKLMFAKSLLRCLWLIPGGLSAFGIAIGIVKSLDQWFGVPQLVALPPVAVTALYTIILFVLWDLSRYVLHRLFHTIPCLWEIHKVHHSAEVLTPFTLYRTHPIETALYSLRGILVTGTVTGVFFYLFRERAVAYQFLGVHAAGFALNLLGANLRHSPVWLSYGTRLERYLISPAQHQIHHSAASHHTNKNLGTWLAVWDRVGGTLYIPQTREALQFGLEHQEQNHQPTSVVSALLAPAWASIARILPRRRLHMGTLGLLFGLGVHGTAFSQTTPTQPSPPLPPTEQDAGPSPQPQEDDAIVIIPDDSMGPSQNETANSERRNDAPEVVTDDEIDLYVDTVSIFGGLEDRSRITGSAYQVTEKELEQFEYNDIHRVLTPVPGVYIRGEDGYGLRPNIGLRGANSDRSAKVTLMEDGILFAPAPYSAPAAYYFPLTSRMAGVEVFKGPASIRYGPNTIGGAINLQTRPIPRVLTSFLDFSAGQDRFGKLHGYIGTSEKRWGILLEGIHLQTDGFKELDSGGNTGFDKNEFMLRGRYHSNPALSTYHQFDVKLGYADERSYETYLGLSQADFDETPRRRYAASAKGLMTWDRSQLQARYFLSHREHLDLQATVYRHDFQRDWTKLNRFRNGPDIGNILANPSGGQAEALFAVLTGANNSEGSNQDLLIGTNARTFVSQGLALVGHWRPAWGPVKQTIELGARLHYDRINRHHTEDGFFMRNQTLVPDGNDTTTITRNRGATTAWAFHIQDQLFWRNLLISPGIRLEIISTKFRDRLSDSSLKNTDTVVVPGIGVHYQWTRWLGILAGIHKGFSPVSPGQDTQVNPESSISYEAGARGTWKSTQIELLGFFNDYSNLTAECTVGTGCGESLLNDQFNGNAVHVYGMETLLTHQRKGPFGLELTGKLSYTLTLSNFRTSFTSNHPQFGDVEKGDELPYVPNHQLSAVAGVKRNRFAWNLSAVYMGAMRDIAGSGTIPQAERIDDHFVMDVSSQFQTSANSHLYLKIDNVLATNYVISKRPFGARPGRPFQLTLGFKFHTGK